MKEGRVVALGHPRDVLTEDLLAEVFGLNARVIPDPVHDGVLVVPVGTRHVDVEHVRSTAPTPSTRGET
jgi:iron complex transport system ATP-binding protein